jgi:hypothetical protein
MAVVVNNSSTNWNNAAGWSVISATGWTALLATQETAANPTPTTFTSGIAFTPGAITIDAILLKITARSTTPTGTVSVRLFNTTGSAVVAGTTVDVNTSDLPNTTTGTWVMFKFAAPVTLLAATNYAVQVASSVASNASFFRKSATANDWTFGLRTTTTQTPTAGDQVLVASEYTQLTASTSYTVTMNVTSGVSIGTGTTGQAALEVNNNATLAWSVAGASTYPMTLTGGGWYTNYGGTSTVGTQASPMPSTSTAVITLTQAANVQHGVVIRGNGVFSSYGATKTTKAYLASNALVGATTLITDVSTSWVSGDSLALASTSRLVAECETALMSGNAVGTSVPVAAISFLHEGSLSSNVAKAEVINLTRNIKFTGTSIALQTYIVAQNSAVVTFGFTEFALMGSATANARGVEFQQTTGSTTVTGCSFRNFEVASSIGLYVNSLTPSTTTISNCVFYRQIAMAIVTNINTTPITISDCWAIGGTAMHATAGFQIAGQIGTYSNLNCAGSVGNAFQFTGTNTVSPYNVSNIIAHSCTSDNVLIQTNNDLTDTISLFTNITSYRSTASGLSMGTAVSGTINGMITGGYLFGNATRGMTLTLCFDWMFSNLNIYGEVAYSQPAGVVFNNHAMDNTLDSCVLGSPVAHTTADINDVCLRNQHQLVLRNCLLASTTEAAGQANYTVLSYVQSAKHDQTTGNQKSYYKYGVITLDNSFFVLSAPSQRLTPNTAGGKLRTTEKRIAVPTGKQAKISVWVRKSVVGDGTVYNGAEVRLIQLADSAIGVSSDVILATTTAASYGAFEKITATTAAVTDNGVVRVVLDCDGTTGWVNCDLWTVEII